ncbi:MAG: homoserine dehydrogenase [Chloroflexota bacterium]|jgi:homoserine dehydrogenase
MKEVPVVFFGAGGVGRALLRQIVAGRAVVAERCQCRFKVVGVLDSRGWIWQPAGLSDEQLEQIVASKAAGQAMGGERPENEAIVSLLTSSGLNGGLMVDVTAADGMEPVIDRALERGYGVVLANKKPLAGPWEMARRYFNQPALRFEATVGGGQPVIATLRTLRDTNDPVFEIEGQLSGTLGFICGRLDEGAPFSQALAEARAAGFTEPDPREDLGGQDVKRKIMILGRLAGWPLTDEAIAVEALYHPSLAHLSVPEFMAASVAMDGSLKDRVEAAWANGTVLRYVARATSAGGSVGLDAVPQGSPLASLKYVSFRTGHYDDEPLLIGGKGAGVEMTAAGVLGDMISLVREMRP